MFDNVGLFVETISAGLLLTVEATVGGIVIATVLSFAFGLAMLSRWRAVRALARVYVEIWRGTSEVVQLMWIYFVLPVLVGYQIVPLAAGIAVLGLNFGAYGAEIVRGAVQSVPRAQYEGAVALSLTPRQRMLRVILPQALVEMVPPFNNLFIQAKGIPGAVVHGKVAGRLREGGNLLWGLDGGGASRKDPFAKLRNSPLFKSSQAVYGPGWTTNDLVGDPRFVRLAVGPDRASDLRLSSGSQAIDAGLVMPADWPDPSRTIDQGKPDIGAVPRGSRSWGVGVESRIPVFGDGGK